jgi:DNA primase
VRELGAEAFEQQVTKAVPLSRQLIEQAAEGADLGTAEGRSRMLAQARPFWNALPEGALKRQLLPELARQAQLEVSDLVALWGGNGAGTRCHAERKAPQAPAAALHRPHCASRAAAPPRPAPIWRCACCCATATGGPSLSSEDHGLLHELGSPYGDVVAWLEQQITEHGDLTWAALEDAMQARTGMPRLATGLSRPTADEEQCLADLQRVVHRLWCARLRDEVAA